MCNVALQNEKIGCLCGLPTGIPQALPYHAHVNEAFAWVKESVPKNKMKLGRYWTFGRYLETVHKRSRSSSIAFKLLDPITPNHSRIVKLINPHWAEQFK